MFVTEGQSFERQTEGKWLKISVGLDENDLLALLAEWGSNHPADLRTRIRTVLAYDILSVQAQLIIALRACTGGGMTTEEFKIVQGQMVTRINKQKVAVGLQSSD